MRRFIVLGLALCAPGAPAHADTARLWVSTNVQAPLSGPWRVQGETVLRTTAKAGVYDVEQAAMLGYRFDQTFTVWLGYVYGPVHTSGGGLYREHRLREQLNVARIAKLGPVRLAGRLRMETRWREEAPGTGWRIRPQLRAMLPLTGHLAMNLTNEAVVNLNGSRFQRPGLERDRTMLSLVAPVGKAFNVEAGYMNQHTFVRAGRDTTDHIAELMVSRIF